MTEFEDEDQVAMGVQAKAKLVKARLNKMFNVEDKVPLSERPMKLNPHLHSGSPIYPENKGIGSYMDSIIIIRYAAHDMAFSEEDADEMKQSMFSTDRYGNVTDGMPSLHLRYIELKESLEATRRNYPVTMDAQHIDSLIYEPEKHGQSPCSVLLQYRHILNLLEKERLNGTQYHFKQKKIRK